MWFEYINILNNVICLTIYSKPGWFLFEEKKLHNISDHCLNCIKKSKYLKVWCLKIPKIRIWKNRVSKEKWRWAYLTGESQYNILLYRLYHNILLYYIGYTIIYYYNHDINIYHILSRTMRYIITFHFLACAREIILCVSNC